MTHKLLVAALGMFTFYPASAQASETWDALSNPSSTLCLDSYGAAGPARLTSCHGNKGNQQWTWNPATGELRNPDS